MFVKLRRSMKSFYLAGSDHLPAEILTTGPAQLLCAFDKYLIRMFTP